MRNIVLIITIFASTLIACSQSDRTKTGIENATQEKDGYWIKWRNY